MTLIRHSTVTKGPEIRAHLCTQVTLKVCMEGNMPQLWALQSLCPLQTLLVSLKSVHKRLYVT